MWAMLLVVIHYIDSRNTTVHSISLNKSRIMANIMYVFPYYVCCRWYATLIQKYNRYGILHL